MSVFRLRYRTIFTAGLAIALASLGIYLSPERLAGQVPSGTDLLPKQLPQCFQQARSAKAESIFAGTADRHDPSLCV